MKLLVDCGLAEARHFNDGQARYEPSDGKGEHHDHLICVQCGKIIEFVDERSSISGSRGREVRFTITNHKMELYGNCTVKCEKKLICLSFLNPLPVPRFY